MKKLTDKQTISNCCQAPMGTSTAGAYKPYYVCSKCFHMCSPELEEVFTVEQVIREIEELEPKNIIDYIYKGSGFNQWVIKHKLKLSRFHNL